MSAANAILGPNARVSINGTLFAVTEGDLTVNIDDAETSDTESWPFKHTKVGLIQFEFNITFEVASDVNPHAAVASGGLGLFLSGLTPTVVTTPVADPTIDLKILPWGVSYGAYEAPTAKITSWKHNFRVQGSQPQTFTMTGKSDGSVSLPASVGVPT